MRTVRKAYEVRFVYEWDVEIPDDVSDEDAEQAILDDIYDRVAEDSVSPEPITPSGREVERIRIERDGPYFYLNYVEEAGSDSPVLAVSNNT